MSSGYGGLVGGKATFAGPDQGIDFTGAGPIYAPDDLKIIAIKHNTGWPGEHSLIVGQLTSGSRKGRYVYFAEDLQPVKGLKPGQTIKKGSTFAQATGSGKAPGIEIGFAKDASGAAYGSPHDGKPGGPTPKYGQQFADYIHGVKPVSSKGSPGALDIIAGAADIVGIPGSGVSAVAGAAGDEASKLASSIVGSLFDAIGKDALRGLLYVVLVGGGVALILRAAGDATGKDLNPVHAAGNLAAKAPIPVPA